MKLIAMSTVFQLIPIDFVINGHHIKALQKTSTDHSKSLETSKTFYFETCSSCGILDNRLLLFSAQEYKVLWFPLRT